MPKPKPIKVGVQDPYKKDVYREYVKWKAIPGYYRKLVDKELRKLGFSDEDIALVRISSQSEFAAKHDIVENTTWRWNNSTKFHQDLMKECKSNIFQKYLPSIMEAFSTSTIGNADAARFKLWMETFAGHVDTSSVEAPGGDEEQQRVTLTDGETIMDIVMNRLSKSRGIEQSRFNQMQKDIEFSDFTEVEGDEEDSIDRSLPSQQQYDFEAIKRKHEDEKERLRQAIQLKAQQEAGKDQVRNRIMESVKKVNAKKK